MELEIKLIKQEKYKVGYPDYDVAGEFFSDIIKENRITKNDKTYIEVKNYQCTDDKLHIMIVDDRLRACVIERRTEFNNLEYTFCAWDITNKKRKSSR